MNYGREYDRFRPRSGRSGPMQVRHDYDREYGPGAREGRGYRLRDGYGFRVGPPGAASAI